METFQQKKKKEIPQVQTIWTPKKIEIASVWQVFGFVSNDKSEPTILEAVWKFCGSLRWKFIFILVSVLSIY